MKSLSTKSMKRLSLTAILCFGSFATFAYADTLRRSTSNPHFTVENSGATVKFNWYAPMPTSVVISKHSGGWNSSAQTVVYDGPPPPSISLIGGGRVGGGRYTITAKNAKGLRMNFNVDVVGPANVKNW